MPNDNNNNDDNGDNDALEKRVKECEKRLNMLRDRVEFGPTNEWIDLWPRDDEL